MRAHLPYPRPEEARPAHTPASENKTPGAAVVWTPGMDSVLQWSWQSGLDLQAVAEELGLSSRDLLLRSQMLAAEGRLMTKVPPEHEASQSGRHRRHAFMQYNPVPDSPETLYSSTSPYI
ncbi:MULTISPECIES: hypothetical protein [unclassified Streptomyces]|uniref:hypothetical protein n=1 Tax=unclassified Streptomyces TaxID=2593676 RepID=UPI0018FE319F|nr:MULTISPECIES: hypothetical protein [unclassified Streptomyces]